MARPSPADEGSPGRLIATMVGIVGILLLGSLAWSAVGALFSAMGEAAAAFSGGTPVPRLGLGPGTPSPQATARATELPAGGVPTQSATARPTPAPTLVVTPTDEPGPASTPPPETPTPSASGRAPWILLPQPAPGARVAPGPQVIEARGRGDSTITSINLELDGAALGVALEQRSDTVWRGSSTTQVSAGHHAVRATVVDDQNRTGSFRWTFDAGP